MTLKSNAFKNGNFFTIHSIISPNAAPFQFPTYQRVSNSSVYVSKSAERASFSVQKYDIELQIRISVSANSFWIVLNSSSQVSGLCLYDKYNNLFVISSIAKWSISLLSS